MDKELKDKIDVGFKVEAEEGINPLDYYNSMRGKTLMDYIADPAIISARHEALKLAYEVAFKQDVFNPTHWNKMTEEKQVEAYQQVFELAEYNCNYIVTGKSGL